MPRSVNHVASKARRKKILKLAKGYYGRRKNVLTVAKNAVDKALGYAYIGRKQKKRHFRSLWIVRINAGARQQGLSYSQLMDKIHKSGIELNRKVLADLAMNHPTAFEAVVQHAISNANNTVAKTVVAPKSVSKVDSTISSKTEVVKSESASKKSEEVIAKPEGAKKSATKADDLKIVEGIGPKIEQLFHEGGIKTFAELAEASVERMQEILDAAGPRYRTHNPGTWAQQGALARDGKWDELKALQESLNGGV